MCEAELSGVRPRRETLTHALGVGRSQITRERHAALLAQAG
jgi:hypothetical protein